MTGLHDTNVPRRHARVGLRHSHRCGARSATLGYWRLKLMEGIVGIVVVVLIVLFVLGYFRRGRISG
jgi:uncharacterized membrane protein